MPLPRPFGLSVELADAKGALTAAERRALVDAARTVLALEGVCTAEVSIVVVDDRVIRAVNREHLDHDWPTDVVSFVLSDSGDPLEGELVVSAETAARVAAAEGVEPLTELTLYVVHGLLHLCGHDDLEPDSAAAMRNREGEALAALGLSHPISSVKEPSPWPK